MPYTDYVVPVGCNAPLPEIVADDCSPVIELSEITNIAVCDDDGIVFADVTSPAEWAGRVNNAGTVPVGAPVGTAIKDVIRIIPVTGEYPKPAVTLKDISGGREKFPTKTEHTVNFTIDDITAQNYKFAQFTQVGTRKVRVWLKTKGAKMIGGNSGIVAKLRIDPVFAKGADAIVELQGVLTWYGTNAYTKDLTISAI